jgi:hypothetical protein
MLIWVGHDCSPTANQFAQHMALATQPYVAPMVATDLLGELTAGGLNGDGGRSLSTAPEGAQVAANSHRNCYWCVGR